MSKFKESHLIQTADFAVAQGIDHKPAFKWWVKHVLKKTDRITVADKIFKEKALALNGKNSKTLWAGAISSQSDILTLTRWEASSYRPPMFVMSHGI